MSESISSGVIHVTFENPWLTMWEVMYSFLKNSPYAKRDTKPSIPFYPDDYMNEEEPVIPNKFLCLKLYRYRQKRGAWKHLTYSDVDDCGGSFVTRSSDEKPLPLSSTVRIVTWNVDLRREWSCERIDAVLRHLGTEVLNTGKDENGMEEPCVVLLQEVNLEAFDHLLKNEWVRRRFSVLPINPSKWPEGATYGVVTLVSRELEVVQGQIVHFGLTVQNRTGLAVWLRMAAGDEDGTTRIICIVNTHLESLPEGELTRPKQLEVLTSFLTKDLVEGGVIAGDMNALSRADKKIPMNAGLKDAWRRGDKDEESHTWGFQSAEADRKYPSNRLDKILYLPRRNYRVDEPQRIGVGVKAETPGGNSVWASDHYGLVSVLRCT